MTDRLHRYPLAELTSRCASPWGLETFSAVIDHPCLVIDLDDTVADAHACMPLAARLAQLPCPVIGVGRGDRVPMQIIGALDVVLDDDRELDALTRNIEQHALAAAALVQVLRHNEGSGIHDGLLMESAVFGTLQAGDDFRAYLARRESPPAGGRDDDGDPVLLERTGPRVSITLNRPAWGNAYSAAMRDALYDALALVAADPSVAVAEIRGAGRSFCSGGDLSEFGLATDTARAHLIRMSRSVALLLADLVGRVEFHVHGACIGSGIELPAFGARIVASPRTFFQLPELSMGLIPGAGGTVSIPRRIGRQRTAYLALSGRRIGAPTALAWGLIDAIG